MDTSIPVDTIDVTMQLVERRTNADGTVTHVLRQPPNSRPWSILRTSNNVLKTEMVRADPLTWHIEVTTRTALETFDVDVLAHSWDSQPEPEPEPQVREIDYAAITKAVSGAIH